MNFSEDQSSSNLSDNKTSQASDDDDYEDDMVTEALQFNQLSLEEYCVILLARVVPMFRGPLCAETAIIESAVNLLHGVLSLSKRVFPPDLWRSGTQLNSLMVSKKLFKTFNIFFSSGADKGSITSHFVHLCFFVCIKLFGGV